MENINNSLNSKDAILLASIQKSGTHWFRYLFANYYMLLEKKNSNPVTYDQLESKLFPNNREYVKDGKVKYKNSEQNLQKYGFSDFLWQHRMSDLSSFKGKIILLYRNPLDYIISRYFYKKDLYQQYANPSDCIFLIDKYAKRYVKIKDFVKQNNRGMMISYEELKVNTELVFGVILKWLGFPFYNDLCSQAVQFSSLKTIKKEEQSRNKPIVGATKSGFFVRDGSIGQWKNYLYENHLSEIENILNEHKIELREFILE